MLALNRAWALNVEMLDRPECLIDQRFQYRYLAWRQLRRNP
jgi:hypothetical protein